MLKYTEAKVTFAEIPDEITLCINLSNCPYHCPDCHSKYLWEDIGEELTPTKLQELIHDNRGVTCICFMGGDNDLETLKQRMFESKLQSDYPRRVAWYTGRDSFPTDFSQYIDYVKIGPYKAEYGPLNNPNTNQRFYAKGHCLHKMDANPNMWYDVTDKFWKYD